MVGGDYSFFSATAHAQGLPNSDSLKRRSLYDIEHCVGMHVIDRVDGFPEPIREKKVIRNEPVEVRI